MKRLLKITAVVLMVCIILGLSMTIWGQAKESTPAKAKETDVKKLFSLMGADKLGSQIMKQMIMQMKRGMPDVPEEYWGSLEKKVNMDELIDLLVPVYQKYLTQEDITGLIEFYNSPLGKRFISAQPSITKDSMQIGQQWGMKIAQQVQDDLKKEGGENK